MDKKQADDLHHAMAQVAELGRRMAAYVGSALVGLAGITGAAAQSALSAFAAGAVALEQAHRRLPAQALAELQAAVAAMTEAEESGELAELWSAVAAAQAGAFAAQGEAPAEEAPKKKRRKRKGGGAATT
jgi:hypothetical protein